MKPLWSLMLALCSLAPWASSSADFISSKMRGEVEKLKIHFRTNDHALFTSPLFPTKLDFEENEQRLLMRESLDVYIRILTDMLNQTQVPAIEHSIMAVRAEIEDLTKHYFRSGEQALTRRLQELWDLKTDDLQTQRKAIRELLSVYRAAVRLGSTAPQKPQKPQKRRRRRHTPRGRVPRP